MVYGEPKTEEERLRRHKERFGTSELPPRGTGLQLGEFTVIESKDDVKVEENDDRITITLPLCIKEDGLVKCRKDGFTVIYKKGKVGPIEIIKKSPTEGYFNMSISEKCGTILENLDRNINDEKEAIENYTNFVEKSELTEQEKIVLNSILEDEKKHKEMLEKLKKEFEKWCK